MIELKFRMWRWYYKEGQGNKRETIQNVEGLSGSVTRETAIKCV